MLLDFFVLGQIPGTNLQITYNWLLILANVVVGLIAVAVILDLFYIKPKQLQQQKSQPKTIKQA